MSSCRLEISHDESVLEEQRRLGGSAPDFYGVVRAEVIDPARDQPSRTLEAFTIDERPLLWLSGVAREALVDSTFFSTLQVVDATSLSPNERVIVGTRKEAAKSMPPERLIEFLLRARIIATYVHIGARLECDRAPTQDGGFRARYQGVHTFYTHEEVNMPLAFEVEIDPGGSISVIGRARS